MRIWEFISTKIWWSYKYRVWIQIEIILDIKLGFATEKEGERDRNKLEDQKPNPLRQLKVFFV